MTARCWKGTLTRKEWNRIRRMLDQPGVARYIGSAKPKRGNTRDVVFLKVLEDPRAPWNKEQRRYAKEMVRRTGLGRGVQ